MQKEIESSTEYKDKVHDLELKLKRNTIFFYFLK